MSARLETALQLVADLPKATTVVGAPPPDTPGWWTVAEAATQVGAWHEALAPRLGDRRAAAAYLASWLAEAPTLAVGLPAVLVGAAPVVDDAHLWVHRHPDGWFDRRAIAPTVVGEGDGEPLLEHAADVVVELTTPLVEATVQDLPVGAPAVWGAVADALGAVIARVARSHGTEVQPRWERAQRLLDGVQRRTGHPRRRPHLLPVTWSGGTALFAGRGTCCLYYRTAGDEVPEDLRYCSTCPLPRAGDGTGRLRDHLERTAAVEA